MRGKFELQQEEVGPNYINAIASKLEHNTTMQAATNSRKPSDTKSSSPIVHLPLAMLRQNLLKISESAFVAVWVHPDKGEVRAQGDSVCLASPSDTAP